MQAINLNEILNPISDKLPCGVDLRVDESIDPIYYQIKDLRQQARSAEKKFQLQEAEDNSLQYWQQVQQLAITILSTKSKDLEILAWLLEALLRVDKFAGLAAGLALSAQVIDCYWETLFPMNDGKDFTARLAAFIGLNGEDSPGSLIYPIKTIPITSTHYALWHYQRALELETINDKQKKEQRSQLLGFNLQDIQKAAKQSSKEFYVKLVADLHACLQNFAILSDIFHKHCAEHVPPTSFIRNALTEVLEHVQFLMAELPVESQIETPNSVCVSNLESQIVIASVDEFDNRAAALKQLVQVANYFSLAEPHSPIPFLLRRAIRWGTMPLPELLKELIADDQARKRVNELTGIEF